MNYLDELEMKWDATKMVLLIPMIMLPMFTGLAITLMFGYFDTCNTLYNDEKYTQCLDVVYNGWSTPILSLGLATIGIIGFFFIMKIFYSKEMKKYE